MKCDTLLFTYTETDMNSRNRTSFEERLSDYRRTGRQDAQNVMDVAELRASCHITAKTTLAEAKQRIKKFLLNEEDVDDSVLSSDVDEGWSKVELRKFLEGWAEEWAATAAPEVLKDLCICEDCRSYGCDPNCRHPGCG